MSWLRIEGRMPHNAKVAPLSDAAFRLHITAMAWCVEEESDGIVPTKVPATLPRAPRGKTLKNALDELVGAGLWEVRDDGYAIHDFLEYNPTAAECAAKRAAKAAAGSAGGRAKASKRLATASELPDGSLSKRLANAKQNSSPNPNPNPDLPETTTQGPDRSSRASRPAAATVPSEGNQAKIPCPPELELSEPQKSMLEMSTGIPKWAQSAITHRLRAGWVGKPSRTMSLEDWRGYLSSAICREWSDPSKRPAKPEPEKPTDSPEERRRRADAVLAQAKAQLERDLRRSAARAASEPASGVHPVAMAAAGGER